MMISILIEKINRIEQDCYGGNQLLVLCARW